MTNFEKILMNKFFQYATECDSLGYVLFFENKPACSIGCSSLQKDYRKVLKGWKVWKKYEHLFEHPNFIFCNEKIFFSENVQIISLYIINKKNLSKCVDDNEIAFKHYLGENFSKENFIEKIENSKNLDLAIENKEILKGIVLGFGEESATAFHKQNSSKTPNYIPPWTDTYWGIGDDPTCQIYPVCFMGNPHSEEVKRLVAVYRQERKQIHKKYCFSRKKLKLVLEALCQS